MNGTRTDEAAVIGVVIGGILGSFVVPGPFAWDTTMLGAILLLVLIGYGQLPDRPREAAGMAAAAAFALLYLLGHFLDDWLHLSGWPEGGGQTREAADKPHENAGWQILLLWLGLFVVVFIALLFARTARGKRWHQRVKGRLAKPAAIVKHHWERLTS